MPRASHPPCLPGDAAGVAAAAAALRAGQLIGLPTETVYGLAADATNREAVSRIFAVKGRPADNPLIVHLADAADLPRVAARSTPLAALLAARFWPGPLTLVLDAHPSLPQATTGGHPTVGVRVPDHALARACIAAADVPVAAPSANRSGRPSPTRPAHVLDDLGGQVAAVLDGGVCRVGVESTVVDARGSRPLVLREGAVTREALASVGEATAEQGPDPRRPAASPGARYRHYAPDCAVVLAAPGQVAATVAGLTRSGVRVGVLAPDGLARDERIPADLAYAETVADPVHLAQRLYDALRAAEQAGVETLVVATVPEVGIGRAVMDRLRRAAAAAPQATITPGASAPPGTTATPGASAPPGATVSAEGVVSSGGLAGPVP